MTADKINPRPIFREVVELLQAAHCPRCNRPLSHQQAVEDYRDRVVPAACPWCVRRTQLVDQFTRWQAQDNAQRPSR